jgi:ElaB/YqjD/DUF883 family membrane-anchored ribosome-binding protein
MNKNEIVGAAKDGVGKVQSIAGQIIDDPGVELEGDGRRIEGSVQQMVGEAQSKLADAADKLVASAAKVSEQAREAYANVYDRVQKTADQVTPLVREQPYAALGVAALAGLFLGLLYAGRGPKIIYVRPRD